MAGKLSAKLLCDDENTHFQEVVGGEAAEVGAGPETDVTVWPPADWPTLSSPLRAMQGVHALSGSMTSHSSQKACSPKIDT